MTEAEKSLGAMAGGLVKDGKKQAISKNITISDCNFFLFTFWVALLILDRLVVWNRFAGWFDSAFGLIIPLVLIAILAVAVWVSWRRLYQLLVSKQFAVSVIAWVLAISVLGTLVIQSGSRDDLVKVYGKSLAQLFYLLGLNDIFHSFWFGGFLVLLSVSTVLVVVKRRSWRFPEWGNLFSHLGVVTVLVGGFIGYGLGFKGFLDLQKGEKASESLEMKAGVPTDKSVPLGFSVMLEDFSIERYKPDYKIYLYEGQGTFEAKKSLSLKDAVNWTDTEVPGLKFRAAKVFPDFYFESELKAAPDHKGSPGMQLQTMENGVLKNHILLAGSTAGDTGSLSLQGRPVSFLWEAPGAKELAGMSSTTPAAHMITFEKKGCCPKEKLEVKPGRDYSLGHNGMFKVHIDQYLPDFVYDMETHKPGTRSEAPNNPALQVTIIETATGATEQRWLFAKMPEFGQNHGAQMKGPELAYQYVDSREPEPKQILIVGKGREMLELENGKIIKRTSLAKEGKAIAGTDVTSYRIYESAQEIQNAGTRSEQWNNPMVQIEVRQGTTIESHYLSAGKKPLFIGDGELALTLQENAENVKAYRSRLAIIEDGRKVLEKTVSVNNPLKYKGFGFYQSSYRKEDPNYSGIMVVKDPGLLPVWSGMSMICMGLVFIYYVRPRFKGRKENDT